MRFCLGGEKIAGAEHGHTQTEDQALLKGRREEADRWMVVVVDFMSSRNTQSTEQSTAPKLHSSRHREHREQCRAMPACLLPDSRISIWLPNTRTQTQAENEKEKENTVQRSRTQSTAAGKSGAGRGLNCLSHSLWAPSFSNTGSISQYRK